MKNQRFRVISTKGHVNVEISVKLCEYMWWFSYSLRGPLKGFLGKFLRVLWAPYLWAITQEKSRILENFLK